MRVSKVYMDHFLSLKGIFLQGLNDLNIIIGKNNAGKSNMAKGIHAFFTLLRNKLIVNENTPLNDKSYYYEHDTSQPITIAITFILNNEEAQLLFSDLQVEVPAAKEYWSGIENRNRITVTIKNVYFMNQYFSYLAEIALGDVKYNPYTNEFEKNVVFQLNEEGAVGFLQHYQEISKRLQKKEVFRIEGLGVTLEDYQLVKDYFEMENIGEEEEAKYNKIPEEIKKLIAESEDYQSFRQNLRREIIILEHEIKYQENKEMEFDMVVDGKIVRKLPQFVLDVLELMQKFSIVFIHDRKEPIGAEEAKKLFYLKNTREGFPKFERLRMILKELVDVNLEMWLNPDGSIDMDVDRMLLIFNGAGIRETLRVILDIYLKDADCILIEEPEVHLHPVVERTLFEHIKEFSKKTQMFITTHSPNFIDVTMPQTLFLVQKKKEQPSKVFNLNEGKLYEIFSDVGINDSEAFFRDALVFIEHWHDENILRILSTKTKYNLNKMNIQFIHINDIERLLELTVLDNQNYKQEKIKFIFLLHENQENLEKMEEMRKKLPPNCIILSRTEILNYLFIPRAILKFLHSKAFTSPETKLAIQNVTEKDIQVVLDDAIENERNNIFAEEFQRAGKLPSVLEKGEIAKMVKDCIYNHVQIKESFTELMEKKRLTWEEYKLRIAQDFLDIEEALEKKWSLNKYALISGKSVLEKIAQFYKTSFDPFKGDGDKLANMVEEGEVDPELIKVFKVISEACEVEELA